MSSSGVAGLRKPAVSDAQRIALEYLIGKTGDASTFAKQVAIWLLRHSANLSRVCVVYVPKENPLASEVLHGIHNMLSSNCSTHLDQVLQAMDTMMRFSVHTGDVMRENFSCGGCTVWVTESDDLYSRQAQEIAFDLAAIQAIETEA